MTNQTVTSPAQLGAVIRAARRAAGLSQADLADRIGTSRRWVTMIETGNGTGAELGRVMAALSALGLRLRIDDAPPELNPVEQALTELWGGAGQ